MSTTRKRRRRIRKRVAVTTPKADKKPIETLTLPDELVFRPLPSDRAPFSNYPLPAGRSIRIGYRVFHQDGSIGEESAFTYTGTEEGFFSLPVTREEYAQIKSIDLWALPYGHAAFHGVEESSKFGIGRINYVLQPIGPPPERAITTTRVMDSVLGYTVAEMNRNKTAEMVTACHTLNTDAAALEEEAARTRATWGPLSPTALAQEAMAKTKRGEALARFYLYLRTGGDWDLKVHIGPIWGQVNRLGDTEDTYYYDVWSNIHFGYVGRAAGFTLATLNLGSNVENVKDHGQGDDAADTTSTAEGFDLYREGRDVTIDDILAIAARHPEWKYAARKPK